MSRLALATREDVLRPLPMQEAVEFWRGKRILRPEELDALTDEAKSRAFFVAGLSGEDVLRVFYDKITKALVNGTTWEETKAKIPELVTPQNMLKLRTAFTTSVLQAYSAGRYKQMVDPDVAKSRRFWRYDAVGDSRTRPSHLAIDGKVLASDDPFWQTSYPPNGFNCRCTVTALSEADVQGLGVTVESGAALGFEADERFRYNPGITAFGDPFFAKVMSKDGLAGKLEPIGSWTTSSEPLPVDAPIQQIPLRGYDEKSLRALWESRFGGGMEVRDALGGALVIADKLYDHVRDNKGQGRLALIDAVLPTIQNPAEVWFQPTRRSDGMIRLDRVYVRQFGGEPIRLVVQSSDGVVTGWSYYKVEGEQPIERKGVLIYRRGKLNAAPSEPTLGTQENRVRGTLLSSTKKHNHANTRSQA